MKVETKIGFEEYFKLGLFITLRRPISFLFTCSGLIILILWILQNIGFNIFNRRKIIKYLVMGIFNMLFLPIVIYLQSKSRFKNNFKLTENISYEFTNEKLLIVGESFSSETNWTKTNKIEELNNWFLIYESNILSYLIPKKNMNKDEINCLRTFFLSLAYVRIKKIKPNNC